MRESTTDIPEAIDTAVVTRLLNDARDDPAQAQALLPLVYQQLRRLAARKMRQERPGATIGATALVHEAYLRLVEQSGTPRWEGRWQFFAAAAEAMRRILVEKARRRARLKRGGGLQRVSLDDAELSVHQPPDDLLALDEALSKLAEQHPEKAQLVKLRYFAGLSIAEASEALDISPATADRHWAFARAWLYRQIRGQ